jgi:plasmid stabilization system protein ParE
MTLQLRIRSRAREDIRAARDWYEGQLAGLGAGFGGELDVAMARIAEGPLMFPRIHKEVRRALTRRFPFAIYFIHDQDRVTVLRILHQARDPREWQR